ncbi:MAG: DUF4197 domain-containing protein [Cytophagales bacterium]
MKKVSILLISIFFLFSSCDENGNIALPTGLSNEEVIMGLKEALRVGTDTSVSRLTLTDGYFADQAVKILLPDEVSSQINTLESGINSAGPFLKPTLQTLYDNTLKPVINDMVLSLNRSAEDAAKRATPIFVDAITGITIADGFNILNGPDTAATNYLRENTFSELFGEFQPDIDNSLSKDLVAGKSANDIFSTYVSSYNSISTASLGLIDPVSDVPLSEYVTNKGLNGLFLKVGEEEKNIRNNPLNRVTDILERVFGGG